MRLRRGDSSPGPQDVEATVPAADPFAERSDGRLAARPTGAPSLRARALRLLTLREHSRLELQRKLGPHAEVEAQLDVLLDELERQGLLSVQRVVESLLHQRSACHGNLRLRQALSAKGLPPADFH